MVNSYDNLTWREAAPGVWQRDIDEVEMFYTTLAKLYEGSGRMFFAITGHISLKLNVPEKDILREAEQRLDDSLRIAWLRLRHEQPAIASRVIYDTEVSKWKKSYETIRNILEQDGWLEQTFKKVSTEQTGAEWCNSDPPAPELPTIFSVLPPRPQCEHLRIIRRDLVLRSPHDVIDGIGTLHLLNRLVNLATDAYCNDDIYQFPSFDGEEVRRLSPPYRIAANVPYSPTTTQQQRIEKMATELAKSGDEPEVIGLPYKKGAVLPGKHQRVAQTLSKEQTARILAYCKEAGATITHAYHAAIAMTLRDLQERLAESKEVQYVNYILRNERGQCMGPFNTAHYAAAVYHSVSGGKLVIKMKLPAETQEVPDVQQRREEFLRILTDMKEFYHTVRDDKDHYAIAPYIWARSTPQIPSSTLSMLQPVPPPKVLPSVSISSMGIMDEIISLRDGPFHVENPWVTGEELANGLGLFLGTFQGCLCLSAAYNDSWHDSTTALEFLKKCEDVVLQGFGIAAV